MMDKIDAEEPIACVICGRPLGYSTDDQPDWPTGPMCGDCYQSREMDNEIWAAALLEDNADSDQDADFDQDAEQ